MCLFKSLATITLLLITGTSCTKSNTNPIIEPKDVSGKWNWLYTYLNSTTAPVNPLTPQNTGINEIITFYPDKSWSKIQNNILTDSGAYSIGHGSRRTDPWTVVQYDSIQYYQNSIPIAGKVDYYFIFGDSLNINPGYSGVFSGDSKWIIRQ